MRAFTKQSAITTFYYLMAVDEKVSPDELQKFDEIGKELDPESFFDYRDSLINTCEKQIQSTIDDDDYYDIVLEGVDKALATQTKEECCIPSRLLIWNMLVMAFCNKEYSNYERRLIKHVIRVIDVDESVFLQMEELLKTSVSVENELTWIKSSNRPYAEVAPIVAELENRLSTILLCAKQLIDDEISEPTIEAIEIKPGVFDDVKAKTGKFFSDTKEKIGEATTPIVADLKKQTVKLFAGLKSKKQSNTEDNAIMQIENSPDKEAKGDN